MTGVAGFASSVLSGFTSGLTPSTDDPVLHGGLTRSRARSLVECAVLSYKSEAEIRRALDAEENSGQLLRFQWFEAVGRDFDSQAFAVVVPGHVILAFRGTKELKDFLTDAWCVLRPLKDFNGSKTPGIGSVHSGFQRALNALWSENRSARQQASRKEGPALDEFLTTMAATYPGSQLWLTGHSLGAALATIVAARIRLTNGAPFQDRLGALVTIGSPRALGRAAADRLRQDLGPEKIYRIHRSIDPIAAVPYRGFRHVSGPKAFVSNHGHLVMGVHKRRRWADRLAASLLALEDTVGSLLPGQHRGLGKFVSDHSSADYLYAVTNYNAENTVRVRDSLAPIAVPLVKLVGFAAVVWAVVESTGAAGLAMRTAAATARLLQTGTETMLAFVL